MASASSTPPVCAPCVEADAGAPRAGNLYFSYARPLSAPCASAGRPRSDRPCPRVHPRSRHLSCNTYALTPRARTRDTLTLLPAQTAARAPSRSACSARSRSRASLHFSLSFACAFPLPFLFRPGPRPLPFSVPSPCSSHVSFPTSPPTVISRLTDPRPHTTGASRSYRVPRATHCLFDTDQDGRDGNEVILCTVPHVVNTEA